MNHHWVTAMNIGFLYPVMCQEVTPGDTWSGVTNGLIRLEPLDRPAFAAIRIDIHAFFVPHRIIWDPFEDVITGVDAQAFPTVNVSEATATGAGSLANHFGLGSPQTSLTYPVCAFPFRAYNSVWNNFWRDQTMQAEVALSQTSILNTNYPASSYYARYRTEIQQGSEETVDTSGSTLGVTAIRDAFHRQKWRERRSQFGERYTDYLAALGIRAPDSRLDRPEHVARGSATVGVSEVVATASSTSEETGDLRGHGLVGIRVRFPKRVFVEHGTLLMVATPRFRQQIVGRSDRQFLVTGKDDLFQPELARDTQVSMDTREIASGFTAATFAYQARDEWLRSARDTIAGPMQTSAYRSWQGGITWDPNSAVPAQLSGISAAIQADGGPQDIFQDTASPGKVLTFLDHRLGKSSIIPSRRSIS